MTPIQHSFRTIHPGWRLGIFLLLLTILAATLAAGFYAIHLPSQRQNGVLQPLPLLGTAVGIVAVVLGATVVCLKFLEGRSLATIGLMAGRSRWTSIAVGLLLGGIVPIVVSGLLSAAGFAAIQPTHLSGSEIATATAPMIAATLLLSSWEEIVFRGYPLQLLCEISGPWLAAIVTGLLFGLAHSGNPGANWLGFLNTALNGVLLAWVVMRSGSLWLGCAYHAGWNLTASTLLGMRDSGTSAPGSPFLTTLSGPEWLSGGSYGFEASLVTGLVEMAVLTVLVLNVRRLPAGEAALPYYTPRPPVTQ